MQVRVWKRFYVLVCDDVVFAEEHMLTEKQFLLEDLLLCAQKAIVDTMDPTVESDFVIFARTSGCIASAVKRTGGWTKVAPHVGLCVALSRCALISMSSRVVVSAVATHDFVSSSLWVASSHHCRAYVHKLSQSSVVTCVHTKIVYFGTLQRCRG